MSTRRPTATLIVDADIVLSAQRGRRTARYLAPLKARRRLATTGETCQEVQRVMARIDPRETTSTTAAFFDALEVFSDEHCAAVGEAAALRLACAPASRDGSPRDAHILALAWALDADIWSHDRDYAGTGWPSWSSANLIAALAGDESPPEVGREESRCAAPTAPASTRR